MAKRILLCDDEIHIVRAVEIKLKRAGYEVQIACDGQEAWEAIQAQKPDMLITDAQMPRLDGLSLVQRLRESPQTRDLPVMMLSGKGLELDAAQLAARWNILRLMGKPFSPRELLEHVNQILGTNSEVGRRKSAEGVSGHALPDTAPLSSEFRLPTSDFA